MGTKERGIVRNVALAVLVLGMSFWFIAEQKGEESESELGKKEEKEKYQRVEREKKNKERVEQALKKVQALKESGEFLEAHQILVSLPDSPQVQDAPCHERNRCLRV